jgi:DNA-binding HxlR family transcriptional regulator
MRRSIPLPAKLRPAASAEIIDELLTIKPGKWTMSVILQLRGQTLRFSELLRSIPGVSQKALTVTLRELERDGFISRTTFATIPPRVDYALTGLGHELLRVMEAWQAFAHRHWTEVMASRQRFDSLVVTETRSVEIVLRRTTSGG